MHIIRKLYRSFKAFAAVRSWAFAGEWTKEDAVAFRAFMDGPSGVKLKAHLVNAVIGANSAAVMKATPHECGMAVGLTHAVSQLETLGDPSLFSVQGDSGTDPEAS